MLDKVRLRSGKQIGRKLPLQNTRSRSGQVQNIQEIDETMSNGNDADDSELLEVDPPSVHIKCENLSSDHSENSNEIPGTSNNEIETYSVDCSDESESESVPENPPEKKTRISKDWDFVQNFSSKSEAIEHIKALNLWTLGSTKSTTMGVKEYFHCRYNRKCRHAIHLLYPIEDNNVVKLYECTDRDHVPHETKRKSHGFPEAQKEIIQKLFMDGIRKPRPILRAMEQQGYGEVPRIKLNNYLAYLRKQFIGKKKNESSGNSNCSGVPVGVPVVETEVEVEGINQNWMENINSWCEGTSFTTPTPCIN